MVMRLFLELLVTLVLEGHFWESINACGVLQIPVVVPIWDDGYGYLYHLNTTLQNDLSKVLSDFRVK